MKLPVALNIMRCTGAIPRGGSDPLWGSDAWAKGHVIDVRPEPGQAL